MMCDNCPACVLESERGRGDQGRTQERIARTAVPTGRVQTHRATDVLLIRCPHLPGCGGCEVHAERGSASQDEELRVTQPQMGFAT